MNKPVDLVDLKGAALTGADAVVEMLKAHGVEVIFGLCGDTSLPLYDALARSASVRHILTRDERHAAYMADGYARVTGKVGVCEGPSGGGATYILPGLVEANESSIPVLAINTDVAVSSRNRFTLTELDQRSLMRPLTKWNAVLDRAADIPRTFRAAFEAMTTGRPGAAHIALPFDVQNAPVERGDVWADPTLGVFPSRRVAPDPFSIELAAKMLRGSKNPVFVCGGGVVLSGAETELQELVEKLNAPVATTVSGKGSIDERCAHSVGVVGSNGGTPATRAVIDQADAIVFVGCRAGSVTTERWRHPAPGRARIIHIDVDPAVPGTNYKVDVPIVADAKLSLSALAEAVTPRDGDLSWVDERKREKFEAFEALARSGDVPIKPERVVAALDKLLGRDAILVADPGTPCPYFSAYYVVKGSGRRFFSNRAHGALGYALAAAIGAHIGRPAVKTVAVMGDGSFGMCVGELETLVRLKLPVTCVVISNGTYGWIKAGQKSGYGQRYFSVDFGVTDHARVADAFGVKSWKVSDPRDLDAALRQAIAHGGPTLVDIVCQPLHEAKAPVSEWVA
ncbi:MAG TPA: thiamine pyrophosphate-binding protein [Burkholderiales bacterium]|jgi:acetolactate synthase-1/2/3 large subunit|nr:thiamine pyrophosphate-binding protein [Burkholderiales bacterium]